MQFKTFDIVPHGTKFDFVGKRKIALILSTIVNLAVILWALPQIHGLDYGVDFAGGTEMQVKFDKNVDPGEIRRNIEALGFKDAVVQTYGPESEHGYLVRVGRVALLTPEDAARVIAAVKAKFSVVGSPAFSPEAGDKIDFEFQVLPGTAELQAVVEASGVKVREIREEAGLTAGTRSLAVLTQGIQDRLEKELVAKFADAKPQVLRVEYVGPAVGRELRNQGFKAILYAMALIAAYVGLRFDFRFSPGVIIAILHDAIITLGYFAVSGREFNLTSVAVILTVVGYSVNDTVVVYDRIRENQGKLKARRHRQHLHQRDPGTHHPHLLRHRAVARGPPHLRRGDHLRLRHGDARRHRVRHLLHLVHRCADDHLARGAGRGCEEEEDRRGPGRVNWS
jgi:preprotein translocase subunit SecF